MVVTKVQTFQPTGTHPKWRDLRVCSVVLIPRLPSHDSDRGRVDGGEPLSSVPDRMHPRHNSLVEVVKLTSFNPHVYPLILPTVPTALVGRINSDIMVSALGQADS